MEEVLKFLRDSKVFYVATIDGEQPRVRPFSGISEFEGKLYMPTNNKKKVFAQMMKNPKVEISGMANGKWIRVEAEVVQDSRREAKAAMLDSYGEALTRMYSLDDGIFEVVYLKNVTATISSFTEEPKVISF
ncbi:MAG: pyridoxamine 5'-phosphate oxidase family protein [Ruminococcus sp.]|nr:pyridoxamine 5'-phosphate oxidase family protein [Ruminococcus sp.]